MPNFTPKRRPRYGFVPFAAARHKHRYGRVGLIRREIEQADITVDLDVLAQMPAPARRDLQDGRTAS